MDIDDSAHEPVLPAQILDAPAMGGESGASSPRPQLRLDDFPAVRAAWAKYVDVQWRPWAESHRRWSRADAVYAELFGVHQDQEREGEQLELVLGLGLLCWKSLSGEVVSRHTLVARAELAFEPERGIFTVKAASEGARLSVELDMLDIAQRPQAGVAAIEERMRDCDDDPWQRSSINSTLSALARVLSDRGAYDADELRPTTEGSAAPLIRFAPAIILRRRSTRGVNEFLKKLLARAEASSKLPSLWRALTEEERDDALNPSSADASSTAQDSMLPPALFPLPSNEEQQAILSRLERREGVVVEGPPGTGKSHTIANLVCHLLASGARVLVTAQTPRALQVLHDKIPLEIRPLCVSILGAGAADQKAIQESVHGIVERQDRWSEHVAVRRVATTQESLEATRAETAMLVARLRSTRQSDAIRHCVAGGAYEGTSSQIADRVRSERERYAWMTDAIDHDSSTPVTSDELSLFISTLREIDAERRAEVSRWRPRLTDLPSAGEFAEKVRVESEAQGRVGAQGSSEFSRRLAAIDDIAFDRLQTAIKELSDSIDALRASAEGWVGRAVEDVLLGRRAAWEERLRASVERTRGLLERARLQEGVAVELPAHRARDVVLRDARDLREYFRTGGKKGLLPFLRPEVVRRTLYLESEARVAGRGAWDREPLEHLIEHLECLESIERAEGMWADVESPTVRGMAMRVRRVEELAARLEEVLGLGRLLAKLADVLALVGLRDDRVWVEHSSTSAARRDLERSAAQRELRVVGAYFSRLLGILQSAVPGGADVRRALVRSVEQRDPQGYAEGLQALAEAERDADRLRQADAVSARLVGSAPRLAAAIRADASDSLWSPRIREFEAAWAWARAESWLASRLSGEDPRTLRERIERNAERTRALVEGLAAEQAWISCFSRMTRSSRESLVGWQQAFRRIGKGTGKYVLQHRRDAQRHLEACRDSIPAWIMPLHTVFETVDPRPEMFDVVIVDEASQCGIDALPLFFLGKRMVVVGDDKQISPIAVGVERQDVFQLLRQYLADLEHKDAFEVDSSLFDLALRRFGNRIRLREHFRCMPEIIEFSNRMYYDGQLQALRQHQPDRLEPLRAVRVTDGIREGSSSNVYNLPEARVLVQKLVGCHRDPRYAGKSFGVIVLQGTAQAKRIERMLLEALGTKDYQSRRLLVGDPYVFQGDERDVVFLTMVAARNAESGVLTTPVHHRRFNVAASRARDQLWMFHSVDLDDLSPQCVRRKLLEHFLARPLHDAPADGIDLSELEERLKVDLVRGLDAPAPFDSWFEVKVFVQIARRGFRVVPQVERGEYRIDLVVEGSKGQLAVECDGDAFHGADRFDEDMARQAKLERSGWSFFRVRQCEFAADPDRALSPLWDELRRRGIEPGWAARAWTVTESAASTGSGPVEAAVKPDSGSRGQDCEPNSDAEQNAEGDAVVDDEGSSGGQDDEQSRGVEDGFDGDLFHLGNNQLPLDASQAADLAPAVGLGPYAQWRRTPLPDPRSESPALVASRIVEIVAAEGPVTVGRVFRLWLEAAGLKKLGRNIREALWLGVERAVAAGELVRVAVPPALHDQLSITLKRSGQPDVLPRVADDRFLPEIPPSELLEVMRRLASRTNPLFTDDLFRSVATLYGRRRLRQPTRQYLEDIWAKRPGST